MSKAKVVCTHCKGSRLWQGETQGRGAFVVCPECAGKGYTEMEYNRFNAPVPAEKAWGQPAAMVFPAAMAGDNLTVSSPGGVPYYEWLNIKPV